MSKSRWSGDTAGDLYITYYDFLFRLAAHRHRIPHSDAECLIQDIFLTLLRKTEVVRDERAWLIGAVFIASRRYWREQQARETRDVSRLETFLTPEEPAIQRLTTSRLLASISRRAGEVVYLHYWLGFSARELADHYGTTPRYAEKLIHLSLEEIRSAIRAKEEVPYETRKPRVRGASHRTARA